MPELPEVEVVRLGLERALVGRTIATVAVAHPRAVRRHAAGAADFAAVLAGHTIVAARRRGKYLWLELGGAMALLGHLGMSGQLLVVPADKPPETHLRIRFTFSDAGRELRFVDQRTFGGLAVVPTGAGVPEPIAHIALDVLDPGFSDAGFIAAIGRRRTGIKRALLDQKLVSGIGNIYADESLWRARLHYARPTETLTRGELGRLLDAAREVLVAALRAGGTSFDSLYVSVNGVSGLFDRSLEVYGRTGQPCSRCQTPVRRDAFMNRSSFTCPRCQPRPRNARW
ncbi:bifunctional DNA-formamidopyrimidine glycosylase/DNA-(apurinic or apyrimidinic site) lyase [Frankia sp. Cas4]|uniref:bifunctional DNA-formamidopyrimidine glycosylase/DNA-(apurinic or apyrimidinic site) lyase n=1 Tax=Frankia sp. Cas4 TaxID=3073927 RepID=UPI002AD1FF69|nr:bifunctional DNA-formamidopyrimidine glycosylase/DNA-(apurinic or apyrimidinic site) lyase [Frankia sp. Cas4]